MRVKQEVIVKAPCSDSPHSQVHCCQVLYAWKLYSNNNTLFNADLQMVLLKMYWLHRLRCASSATCHPNWVSPPSLHPSPLSVSLPAPFLPLFLKAQLSAWEFLQSYKAAHATGSLPASGFFCFECFTICHEFLHESLIQSMTTLV